MGILTAVGAYFRLRRIMGRPPEELAQREIEWLLEGERIRRCEALDPYWLGNLVSTLSAGNVGGRESSESRIASIGIWCRQPNTAIVALNALSRLGAKDEASINFITDCLYSYRGGQYWDQERSVSRAAEAILASYTGCRELLDCLVNRRGGEGLETLHYVDLIGPGTHWPVWEYVIHYFLQEPSKHQTVAAEVVSHHRIPLKTIQYWLDAIPTERFAANIGDEVATKVFGLCDILACQYRDSAEAASTVVALIERLYSVPGEYSALHADIRAIKRLTSILKQFPMPVAEMALLKVIRRNRRWLLQEEDSPDPWGISGRFIGSDNPQDVFCNAVDDLVEVAGDRTEELLIRVARECRGAVKVETIEHVRQKLR